MDNLIIKFLRSNSDSRLTNDDKWLVDDNNEFSVYQRKAYAKKSVRLITTENLRIALGFLQSDKRR